MNVYLNIYDLSSFNKYIHIFGLGAYHSGIEIGPYEYFFAAHDST